MQKNKEHFFFHFERVSQKNFCIFQVLGIVYIVMCHTVMFEYYKPLFCYYCWVSWKKSVTDFVFLWLQRNQKIRYFLFLYDSRDTR